MLLKTPKGTSTSHQRVKTTQAAATKILRHTNSDLEDPASDSLHERRSARHVSTAMLDNPEEFNQARTGILA